MKPLSRPYRERGVRSIDSYASAPESKFQTSFHYVFHNIVLLYSMPKSLIVAMNQDGLIGQNGQLPWNIPEDLRRFSRLTKGATLVMGRKTFESLPGGRPLKGRPHIVITREPEAREPEAREPDIRNSDSNNQLRFTNADQAKTILKNDDKTHFFIIGGSDIYRECLPPL